MAAVFPSVKVSVDWDNSGAFGASEDVTADVRKSPPLQIQRGRDQMRELSPPMVGSATFQLDNKSGTYSSQNPGSAIYPNVVPGRLVGIDLTNNTPQGYSQTVLNDSPAGYWRLGEASGTSAADASGNANTGTYTGGVTLGQAGALGAELDGTSNTAALFDGSSGYVTVPDATGLHTGDVFTLEAWVSPTSVASPARIISKGTGGYALFIVGGGTLRFSKDQTATVVDATVLLAAGTWQHVAVTKNGAAVNLYVNGASATGAVTNSTIVNTTDALNIGREVATSNQWFPGLIDEVAVYPTALSAARIAAHYAAGLNQDNSDKVSTTYKRARNYLDVPKELPGPASLAVDMPSLDGLGKLKAAAISTAILTNVTTDVAIAAVLDAAGWPSGPSYRQLDVGATVLAEWWADGIDAFTAIRDLVFSEGPPAIFYVDGGGVLRFESRHYRLLTARSTAVQATIRSSGTEPLFADLAYDPGIKSIVNDVAVPVNSYTTAALAVIWTGPTPISLGSGESRSYAVSTTADAFTAAVNPAGGTDYTVTAGTVVSATLNRSSGATAILTITAGASGVTLTGLQVRAQPITVSRQIVRATIDVSASQAAYGVRTLPSDFTPKWLPDVLTATDYCNYVVSRYQTPVPQVTVSLNNGDGARMVQALTRQISDRVRIKEPLRAFVDADFFIEAAADVITAGTSFVTTFRTERANDQTFWVLGDPILGALGSTTRLGF